MKTFNIASEEDIHVDNVDKELFDFTGMKRVSIFNYCLVKTGGACDFECREIPEDIMDRVEGSDGFRLFPSQHSRFCIRACPRFDMFHPDKASKIIELLSKREVDLNV